jgi:hypothetical protein
MRKFKDGNGVEWTVFEVKRQTGATERWSYLPEAFGGGWLCFESARSKRRLTPIPQRWREYQDEQLERMLRAAQPVNRPRFSGEDRPVIE